MNNKINIIKNCVMLIGVIAIIAMTIILSLGID